MKWNGSDMKIDTVTYINNIDNKNSLFDIDMT